MSEDTDYATQLYNLRAPKTQPAEGEFDYATRLYSTRSRSMALAETPTGIQPQPGLILPQQIQPGGAGFKANFKAEFVRDPQTQKQIFAKAIFGDPARASDIYQLDDGRFAASLGNGQFKIVDEGVGSTLGEIAGQAPEAVAGAVGTFVTGNPFVGAVAGEVGGRALKQMIGALVFDEPQTMKGNALDLAQQAAFAAVPEAIGAAGVALANRRALRNADTFDLNQVEAFRTRVRDTTGIDLDFAQASDFRQLRNLKKWASKFPSEAAEVIDQFQRVQQGQTQQAVKKILDNLAPSQTRAAMAASGVSGAKAVLDAARLERKARTRQLFELADAARLPVDAHGRLRKDPLFGSIYKSVVNDPLYRRELMGKEDTVKTWDLVLRQVDDRISTAKRKGANNEARMLTDAREELLESLTQASPEYAAARAEWAKVSQELVNPLEDSSIGVLAALEEKGFKMTEAAAAAARDILADPHITSRAKTAIERYDPQAWRNLVRLSMETEFEKAAKETAGGEVVNFAGKFRSYLIGTDRRRQAMEVALGKSGDDLFDMTMDAFERIARDKNLSGSDTAFNLQISEQMKDTGRGMTRRLIDAARTPLQTLAEFGDRVFLEEHSVEIARALTDPRKAAQLRELRKVPDPLKRGIAIFGLVFGDTTELLVDDPINE